MLGSWGGFMGGSGCAVREAGCLGGGSWGSAVSLGWVQEGIWGGDGRVLGGGSEEGQWGPEPGWRLGGAHNSSASG